VSAKIGILFPSTSDDEYYQFPEVKMKVRRRERKRRKNSYMAHFVSMNGRGLNFSQLEYLVIDCLSATAQLIWDEHYKVIYLNGTITTIDMRTG
jgi:hypothetical protein